MYRLLSMHKKIIFSLLCVIIVQQPALHAGLMDSFFDGVGKGAGKEIGKTVSQTILGFDRDRIILALIVVGGLLLVRYIYINEQRNTRMKKRSSHFWEPSLRSKQQTISSYAAIHYCAQRQ